MNFVISEELLTVLLNYLAQKPYSEVSALIEQLRILQTVNIIPASTDVPASISEDVPLLK